MDFDIAADGQVIHSCPKCGKGSRFPFDGHSCAECQRIDRISTLFAAAVADAQPDPVEVLPPLVARPYEDGSGWLLSPS